MSLRTVALDTPRLWRSTSDLEPMGSLVATKSATMARSTSKRRSSALPICSPTLRSSDVHIARFIYTASAAGLPIALSHGARRCAGRFSTVRATTRRGCRLGTHADGNSPRDTATDAAGDDLQRRPGGQAVPGARPVLPAVGAASPPASSASTSWSPPPPCWRWTACCRRTRRSTAICSPTRCGGRATSISKTVCTGPCGAALRNRTILHARVFDMDALAPNQSIIAVGQCHAWPAIASRRPVGPPDPSSYFRRSSTRHSARPGAPEDLPPLQQGGTTARTPAAGRAGSRRWPAQAC